MFYYPSNTNTPALRYTSTPNVSKASEFFMIVSISFNGLQRKVTSRDQIQVTLSDKTRVTDLLSSVQECYPDIPINRDAIPVFINNKLSNLEQSLEEDDQICFIPHIGGG
jgi:molybdopterin converting factor small subunit